MNIDWSKAPEDATHYSPGGDVYSASWIKWVNGELHGWLKSNDTSWGRLPFQEKDLDQISLHVDRPKKQEAWNGVCIPPIDSECKVVEGPALWEHSGMSDWIGRNVKVKSTFINNIGQQIASVESDNSECACFIVECLRPIKTAEQLADEERKSQLEVMHKIYMEGASEHKGGLAALYDAGYKLAK